MRPNEARQFAAKALFLSALFYAVSLLLSGVFVHVVDWRAWQDPRKRLLYESIPDDSDIILLGDSIWISSYVESEKESLWKVLENLTGKRVFNATLNGADPPDFLNAIKLLPQRSKTAGVVFLDVNPTRLLVRTYTEPAGGNYAGEFSRLTADNPVRRGFVWLRRPLLIFDTEIVVNYLLRRQFFSVGYDRDRVWMRDGDFALKRFRTFERYLADTDVLRQLDWLSELSADLGRKGYRLVVVIMPTNQFLIREYASNSKAEVYLARLARAHAALLAFLYEKHIDLLDCYGEGDVDGFADLIHTNARGDRLIAEKIADYLRSHRQE